MAQSEASGQRPRSLAPKRASQRIKLSRELMLRLSRALARDGARRAPEPAACCGGGRPSRSHSRCPKASRAPGAAAPQDAGWCERDASGRWLEPAHLGASQLEAAPEVSRRTQMATLAGSGQSAAAAASSDAGSPARRTGESRHISCSNSKAYPDLKVARTRRRRRHGRPAALVGAPLQPLQLPPPPQASSARRQSAGATEQENEPRSHRQSRARRQTGAPSKSHNELRGDEPAGSRRRPTCCGAKDTNKDRGQPAETARGPQASGERTLRGSPAHLTAPGQGLRNLKEESKSGNGFKCALAPATSGSAQASAALSSETPPIECDSWRLAAEPPPPSSKAAEQAAKQRPSGPRKRPTRRHLATSAGRLEFGRRTPPLLLLLAALAACWCLLPWAALGPRAGGGPTALRAAATPTSQPSVGRAAPEPAASKLRRQTLEDGGAAAALDGNESGSTSDELSKAVLATMSTQAPPPGPNGTRPPLVLVIETSGAGDSAGQFQLGQEAPPLVEADIFERLLDFGRIFIMGAIIVGDICGNSLVILSVCRHSKLRVTTNWFVVSLACADILVALFAMTFNASVIISGRWLFKPWVCDFWNSCDVLASTASILHLCCISIDRYIAITRPLDYPMKITTRRVIYALCGVWISSALLSYIPIFTGVYTTAEHIEWLTEHPDQCDFVVNRVYAIVSSSISFWIPSSIMVFTYWRIYREATRQEKFIYRAQNMVPAPVVQSANHQHHHHHHQNLSDSAACNRNRAKQRRSKSVALAGSSSAGSHETRIRHLARQQLQQQQQNKRSLAPVPPNSLPGPNLAGVATTQLNSIPAVTLSDDCQTTPPSVLSAAGGEMRASSLVQLDSTTAGCATLEASSQANMSNSNNNNNDAQLNNNSNNTLNNNNGCGIAGGHAPSAGGARARALDKVTFEPRGSSVATGATAAAGEGKQQASDISLKRVEDDYDDEEEDEDEQEPNSGQSTPTKRSISKMKREHKAAKTLGIIMGVFILCWFPFFSWYTPQHICGHACDGIVPRGAVTILFWIGYFNSTLNPIIYAYFNHEFRDAFKKTLQWIFCCCRDLKCLRVSRPNDNQHYNCTYRSTQEIGLVSNS